MRKDYKILQILQQAGKLSKTDLEKYNSVPLVVTPTEYGDSVLKDILEVDAENKEDMHHVLLDILGEMPLYEYMYLDDGGIYYYISIKNLEEYVSIEMELIFLNDETMLPLLEGPSMVTIKIHRDNLKEDIVIGSAYPKNDEHLNDTAIKNIAIHCFRYGIAIFTWANSLDKYPVRKEPIKSVKSLSVLKGKKYLKGLSKNSSGILFLNKPSDISTTTSLGDGEDKASFQRRGTKWTMRAECYKNHPKYLIEKGNYRKPAWIGDKVVNYKGSTYTVLL